MCSLRFYQKRDLWLVVNADAESAERNDGYTKGAFQYYWCILDSCYIEVQHGWAVSREEAFKQAERYYDEYVGAAAPTSKFVT